MFEIDAEKVVCYTDPKTKEPILWFSQTLTGEFTVNPERRRAYKFPPQLTKQHCTEIWRVRARLRFDSRIVIQPHQRWLH